MDTTYIKQTLINNNYTCVLFHNDNCIMNSKEHGVSPLYQYILNTPSRPYPLVLGDKVIGRAAAFLAVYAGVNTIYTQIISETAIDVLEQNDITYYYEEKVPYIYNRNRDGQCPMESSLENIHNPIEAWHHLDAFIKRRDALINTKN